MEPSSQRSSKRAPRAIAIWPSGTPSENSKRGEEACRAPIRTQEAEKRSLDLAAALHNILRHNQQTRVGMVASLRLHQRAHAASSVAGSAAWWNPT